MSNVRSPHLLSYEEWLDRRRANPNLVSAPGKVQLARVISTTHDLRRLARDLQSFIKEFDHLIDREDHHAYMEYSTIILKGPENKTTFERRLKNLYSDYCNAENKRYQEYLELQERYGNDERVP